MSDTQEVVSTKSKAKAPFVRPAFQPSSLTVREFAAKDYNFTVPTGTLPEELLRPSIWSNNAKKFRTGTYLHITAEDGTWAALYRVYAAGDTWAKVHQCWLSPITADAVDGDPTPPEARYKIDHIGSGWRVIHLTTGKVVKNNLPRRSDAEAFIQQEIKTEA